MLKKVFDEFVTASAQYDRFPPPTIQKLEIHEFPSFGPTLCFQTIVFAGERTQGLRRLLGKSVVHQLAM